MCLMLLLLLLVSRAVGVLPLALLHNIWSPNHLTSRDLAIIWCGSSRGEGGAGGRGIGAEPRATKFDGAIGLEDGAEGISERMCAALRSAVIREAAQGQRSQ